MSGSIRGVIDPIVDRDIAKVERIDVFEAADVEAVLFGIGAPPTFFIMLTLQKQMRV